jgi:hypothetical protein
LRRKAWQDLEWGKDGGHVMEDVTGVVGMHFWWDDMNGRTWARSPVSVKWNGFIKAPVTGDYSFFLNSDDGSYLDLDGVNIVDNGGAHGVIRVGESVWLEAGMHEFQYMYMDHVGSMVNNITWIVPGHAEAEVPDDVFRFKH